jgi:hypothetical protein
VTKEWRVYQNIVRGKLFWRLSLGLKHQFDAALSMSWAKFLLKFRLPHSPSFERANLLEQLKNLRAIEKIS